VHAQQTRRTTLLAALVLLALAASWGSTWVDCRNVRRSVGLV
jgi:hypothetical protein